jgi:hypothetical protein
VTDDSEWVEIDRPLYLTEDGGRVVEEGDPAQRWLHWPKGARVRRAEYDRLTRKVETVELPKERQPQANKQRTPRNSK